MSDIIVYQPTELFTSIDIYQMIGFLSIHAFLNIIKNEEMELAHIKNRIHEVRGMKIMLDFDWHNFIP